MRITLLLVLAFASSAHLEAQDARFQGIEWGNSLERTQSLLRGLGYEALTDTATWAHNFEGEDGEGLVASTSIAGRGLFFISRFWRASSEPRARLHFQAEHRRLAEAFGRDADTVRIDRYVWVLPNGTVSLRLDTGLPGRRLPTVFIQHGSPTAPDELQLVVERMHAESEAQAEEWFRSRVDAGRWGVLYAGDSLAVSFDRRSLTRPASGVIRTWLRWDNRTPQTQTSYPRQRFTHTLEFTEIRCRPMGTRIKEAHWYFDAQNVHSERQDAFGNWDATIPDTVGEAIVEEACRTLSR